MKGPDWFALLVILGALLGIGWWVLVLVGPCDWIDWAPAADVPGRCFR